MLAIGNRARVSSKRKSLYAVLAGLLAVLLIAPAASATSLVAQLATEDEEDSSAEAAAGPSLTHDQILFMEDNWNLADGSILVEEEPEPQPAPRGALGSHDAIKFLEDNWHLAASDLFLVEEEESDEVRDSAQIRDDIQFMEDNWYYVSPEDDQAGDDQAGESHKPMTRAEMYFLEQNSELGLIEDESSSEENTNTFYPCCGEPRELDY